MWIVVPVKTFSLAKSRLAAAVSAAARQALAQDLAALALQAALATPGVEKVFALTADPVAAQLANRCGAQWLPESAGDFNQIVTAAFDTLSARGATRLMYLASDLPDISAEWVTQFVAAHRGDLSIGRAARDGGTNALLFDTPQRFPLAFGHNSAAQHLALAQAAGLRAQFVDLAGISEDLDTPLQLPQQILPDCKLGAA